jgi:hypothetical protein
MVAIVNALVWRFVNVKDIDDTAGTATYLGKPPRTLEQWRYRGEGPPYVKLSAGRGGGSVRYRKLDVDTWLAENTVQPSSAA